MHFFDDKINYLLELKEKDSGKVLDNNLLNFYLSSITVENFNYEPNDKTKRPIWDYLNASNLIKGTYNTTLTLKTPSQMHYVFVHFVLLHNGGRPGAYVDKGRKFWVNPPSQISHFSIFLKQPSR